MTVIEPHLKRASGSSSITVPSNSIRSSFANGHSPFTESKERGRLPRSAEAPLCRQSADAVRPVAD